MKLNLEWSPAINSRVLVGTVQHLDLGDQSATIMLNGIEVAGIKAHYRCNHGADTHLISRVLKIDDSVLVLYTGQGDNLSHDNCTIMGLYGEIRTCRGIKGIRAFAYPSSTLGTFAPPVPYPVSTWYISPSGTGIEYFFDGITAEKTASTTNHIDWSNSLASLTWQWSTPNRYKGSAVSSSLYSEGIEYAKAPGAVIGAAIKIKADQSNWLVVGCKEGPVVMVYTRPMDGNITTAIKDEPEAGDNPQGWLRIGQTVSVFSTRPPETTLCFSQDANNAVISNGQELCILSINIDQKTIYSTLETPSGTNWWPFADYKNNALVRAIAEIKVYSATTENTDTGPIYDRTVMNDPPTTGTQYGHSIYTSTTTETYYLKLSTPFSEINCHSHSATLITTSTKSLYRITIDSGNTWGPWYEIYTGTDHPGVIESTGSATGTIQSDCIVDIDLRYDFMATYHWSQNYNNSGTTTFTDQGEVINTINSSSKSVTAQKICDNVLLSSKSIIFDGANVASGQFDGFFHPSIASNATRSPYMEYYLGAGNNWPSDFTMLPVGWLPLYNRGYNSVINGLETRMTSWLHDPEDPAYIYYTLGNPSELATLPSTTSWAGIDLI